MNGPWTVTSHKQHPKAAPVWLLHDRSSHAHGQVATFLDCDEAEAVAQTLNAADAGYRAAMRALDTDRDF